MHRRLILIACSLSLVCVPQLLAPGRAPAAAAASGAARLVLPAAWFEVVDPYRYVEARRYEAGWNRGADVAVEGGLVRAPVTGRVQFAGRVAGREVVTIAARLGGVPVVVTLTGLEATDGLEEGARIARGTVVGTGGRVHVGAYDRRRRSRYLPVVAVPPGSPPPGRGSDAAAVDISGVIARRLEDAIGGVADGGGAEPVTVPGASFVAGAVAAPGGAASARTGGVRSHAPGAGAATSARGAARAGSVAAGAGRGPSARSLAPLASRSVGGRGVVPGALRSAPSIGSPSVAHPTRGIAAATTTAIGAARRALAQVASGAAPAASSRAQSASARPARTLDAGTQAPTGAGDPSWSTSTGSADGEASGQDDTSAAPSGVRAGPGGDGSVTMSLPVEADAELGVVAATTGRAPDRADRATDDHGAGEGVSQALVQRPALVWVAGLGSASTALALAGALLLRRRRRRARPDPPSSVLAPLPVLVPTVQPTGPARDRARPRPAQAIESPDRGRVTARTRHGHERDRAPEHA